MFGRLFNRLAAYFDLYFWLTLLLSIPAISPLLRPNYHWGAHDARHAVYFLHQFNSVIQDGIWYPRWAPDFAFGQGYPFFNIYGPLSSYAGQFFLFTGLEIVDAVKVVFALSVLLSGLTMYLFVRHLMGSQPGSQVGAQAGLVAGISYVYIPYHLLDVYVRAALAESVSFIFIPLVFWGLYEATLNPRPRTIILAGMAYAGLVLTSNLVTFLLSPFLGLYVLVLILNRGINLSVIWRGIPSALVIGLGICLSGIFFFPMAIERQFINVDQWTDGDGRFVFSSFFVEIFQLFSPHWGFGIAVAGPEDDMSYQLGLVPIILFFLSFMIVPRIEQASVKRTLRYLQGLIIGITFLTLPLSLPIWNVIPLASLAQFPWRLLIIVAPSLAILAGCVVYAIEKPAESETPSQPTLLTIIPLTLLIMLASFPYVQAELREPFPTEGPVSLLSLFRFQQSADELTGVTTAVEEIPTWSNMAEYIAIGGNEINTRVLTTEITDDATQKPLMGVHSFENDSVHEFVWVFAADDQQVVTFQIPDHPGWTATLYEDTAPDNADIFPYGRIGEPIADLPIQTTSPEGWLEIPVPAGTHFLEVRFEDTPIRVLGTQISLITAILMILGLILDKPLLALLQRFRPKQQT